MPEARNRLRLDQILVPADRLRKVDDAKALVIGRSIAAGGQIQPIVIRPTPAGERPYTLVDGETRYRGSELNELAEIDVVIRKLNPAQARLVEIEANLIRDELDKLERAIAITEYRRLWEEEHGEIRRGNPEFANSRNLRDLASQQGDGDFFDQALDKFGLTPDTIDRARKIASLQKPLIAALSNTPTADNQSELLKLAKLEPARQIAVADWLTSGKDADVIIHEALYGRSREQVHAPDRQKAYQRITASWDRTGSTEKWLVLRHIGVADILTDAQLAILVDRFGAMPDEAAR